MLVDDWVRYVWVPQLWKISSEMSADISIVSLSD